MEIVKKLFNGLFYVVVLAIIVVVSITYFKIPFMPRLRFYAVMSQSMNPLLVKGDLVLVEAQRYYKKGDVITFKNPKSTKKSDTITHRITSIGKESGRMYYETKGDANSIKDDWKVFKELVIGSFRVRVPYIGAIVSFIKTPVGLISLVVIPGTIILYREFLTLKNELAKLFVKKESVEQNDKKDSEKGTKH